MTPPEGDYGSMLSPRKIEYEGTGKKAAIAALKDLKAILPGEAGTTIDAAPPTIDWAA